MARLNRNIITTDDVANLQAAAGAGAAAPRTLAASPPAAAAPGGVVVPTADDYMTKLFKYIPLEVLGAYLFTANVVTSNVTAKHDLAVWLGSLLCGFAVIIALYDWRVLNVVRVTQIVISVIGFGVYVFAIGGWFATTTWYHQWYASIALPAFALLVALVPLKPLPQP